MDTVQVTSNTAVVDQLNSFLRGELAAAETYRQALEKVKDAKAREVLNGAQQCHAERVVKLREKIRAYGGEPTGDSGAWGTFAKLVEGAAAPFGDAAAVAVLEEGEDHGLRDYKSGLAKLDAGTQQWFQTEIMSAQHTSHAKVSELKRSMARA